MNHQASELRVSSAQLTLINSNVPGLSLNFAAVRQLPQTQPVSSGSTLLCMCVGRAGCLMAYYLSTAAVVSSYGAAGSLVVILMWIYFTSGVLLLSASVARAWSDQSMSSSAINPETPTTAPGGAETQADG